MLFGNHMVEKTLVIYFSRAEGHYSMTQVSGYSLFREVPYLEFLLCLVTNRPQTHMMNSCILWSGTVITSKLY